MRQLSGIPFFPRSVTAAPSISRTLRRRTGPLRQNDALWQDAIKDLFDPCPAGWRVPLSGAGERSPWLFSCVEQETPQERPRDAPTETVLDGTDAGFHVYGGPTLGTCRLLACAASGRRGTATSRRSCKPAYYWPATHRHHGNLRTSYFLTIVPTHDAFPTTVLPGLPPTPRLSGPLHTGVTGIRKGER